MKKYECACGYVYDPAKGDPDSGVAPGTACVITSYSIHYTKLYDSSIVMRDLHLLFLVISYIQIH